MAPLNNAGEALAVYPHEGRPTLRALGEGPNGERFRAECGGCVAELMEQLYQLNLDLLDTMADTLTSHAELRVKLESRVRFGL